MLNRRLMFIRRTRLTSQQWALSEASFVSLLPFFASLVASALTSVFRATGFLTVHILLLPCSTSDHLIACSWESSREWQVTNPISFGCLCGAPRLKYAHTYISHASSRTCPCLSVWSNRLHSSDRRGSCRRRWSKTGPRCPLLASFLQWSHQLAICFHRLVTVTGTC